MRESCSIVLNEPKRGRWSIETHLGFPVRLQAQQTPHLPVLRSVENASADHVARVRVNAVEDLQPMSRYNLTLLREVDVACCIKGDGEDALRLPRRAADELPPREGVGGAELHALEELGDHDREPDGDRLVGPGEEGDDEDGAGPLCPRDGEEEEREARRGDEQAYGGDAAVQAEEDKGPVHVLRDGLKRCGAR